MKNKNLTFSAGCIALILTVCSQIIVSCAPVADPDKIFLKELDLLVVAMQNGKEVESMASLRQMELFSKKYPHNKYADDAQFIVIMVIVAGRWNPEIVRNFLVQCPTDKLEDETLIQLEKVMGPDVYLPYATYFLLPEALYDAKRKDFRSAKEKDEMVLQAIDSSGNLRLQKLRPYIVKVIAAMDAKINNKQT